MMEIVFGMIMASALSALLILAIATVLPVAIEEWRRFLRK